MRPIFTAIALACTPLSAHAWQASASGDLCLLSHREAGAEVELTFDPSGPLYTITVTTPTPWPEGAVFAMRFEGARPIFIQTGAQVLSADRRALTVTDRGFGNVLDGLEFNRSAQAMLGEASVEFSLDGAAPEVAAFRACGTAPLA